MHTSAFLLAAASLASALHPRQLQFSMPPGSNWPPPPTNWPPPMHTAHPTHTMNDPCRSGVGSLLPTPPPFVLPFVTVARCALSGVVSALPTALSMSLPPEVSGLVSAQLSSFSSYVSAHSSEIAAYTKTCPNNPWLMPLNCATVTGSVPPALPPPFVTGMVPPPGPGFTPTRPPTWMQTGGGLPTGTPGVAAPTTTMGQTQTTVAPGAAGPGAVVAWGAVALPFAVMGLLWA